MNKIRFILAIVTFLVVSADVFLQLTSKIVCWDWALKAPASVGILIFAVMIAATASHILLSVMQGTHILDDIIQEEPIEELVN